MKRIAFYYLFGLVSLFFLGACEKPQEHVAMPPVVTVLTVKPETIPAVFQFVGVAKSSHPVEIRARVEGYLWSIDYIEGGLVKKDQLLFQIDPRPFEASLQESLGVLAREEAILWNARQSLARIQPLVEKNAASQRDLDNAMAEVLAAEANVLTAKANVTQAQLNLSYTKVTSPIDGYSGRAVFQDGTLITPNVNGLLTMVSVIDPIWVLFSVSDNQLLQGQGEQDKKQLILPSQQEYKVQLELSDGSIFPHEGYVNFSSPTLDPDTGALIVRATFPNPEGKVLPGQFVRTYVYGAVRPDAIVVPQQAVASGQSGEYVFVLDEKNVVSMRNVVVGVWYENGWVIREGLNPGDRVIVEGINKVAPGIQVQPEAYQPQAKRAAKT